MIYEHWKYGKVETTNKYEEIHTLFEALATEKHRSTAIPGREKTKLIQESAKTAKASWKNLLNIETLTELKDSELEDLTRVVRNRIKTVAYEDERSTTVQDTSSVS